MNIKIGDRVKIREDLQAIRYGEELAIGEMLEYAGCITTVEETEEGKYFLDVDNGFWTWTPEMLIPVAGTGCFCGSLLRGTDRNEITVREYREAMEAEPVLTPKNFRKFLHCPVCGRLIDWGNE